MFMLNKISESESESASPFLGNVLVLCASLVQIIQYLYDR